MVPSGSLLPAPLRWMLLPLDIFWFGPASAVGFWFRGGEAGLDGDVTLTVVCLSPTILEFQSFQTPTRRTYFPVVRDEVDNAIDPSVE
ncbi:hypothetical protein ES703_124543 [subsurface metagenome]